MVSNSLQAQADIPSVVSKWSDTHGTPTGYIFVQAASDSTFQLIIHSFLFTLIGTLETDRLKTVHTVPQEITNYLKLLTRFFSP